MIGAKVVRHGRYVTFQLAEWTSEHGQITKIRSSDGCGENAVPSPMVREYDFHEVGCHLGTVGHRDLFGCDRRYETDTIFMLG